MDRLTGNARDPARRRIVIAVGVSLLLHFAVLAKHGAGSAESPAGRGQRLELLLRAPAPFAARPIEAPAPSVADSVVQAPAPAPQRSAAVPNGSAAALKPVAPAVAVATPTPAAAAPAPASLPVSSPASTPASRPLAELPLAPAKASNAIDQASGVPWPTLGRPLRRVAIEFALVGGTDGKTPGSERHVYVADDAGHYGLSIGSTPDAAGGEAWQVDVSGMVTRQGLRPELFQRAGALPERLVAPGGPPRNGAPRRAPARSGRFADGLLDRQSLLYQFMHKPPDLGGGELWLSDGAAHAVYGYRLAAVEALTLPTLGALRTIKLVLSVADSAELIELWLVPSLHYLPVKVRHTDGQGGITEQQAIAIDFDE